jgi:periplasmic protein TonB
MSDLGSLSECLVDSDADARVSARQRRSKALTISAAFELALLAAIILWPLFSPSVLATQYTVTPAPPYSGGKGPANHPHSAPHPPKRSQLPTICLAVCAPITHPFASSNDSVPPSIGESDADGSEGLGIPGNGSGIRDSIGDRAVIPEPPRPEPPHSQPLRRSSEIMAAMLIRRVDPVYPAIAIAAHISGTVHLHAIIGKDGTVRELEVVDGNALLALAAKAAVQTWRYRPTLLSGEAVEVETYITVNFVLN